MEASALILSSFFQVLICLHLQVIYGLKQHITAEVSTGAVCVGSEGSLNGPIDSYPQLAKRINESSLQLPSPVAEMADGGTKVEVKVEKLYISTLIN